MLRIGEKHDSFRSICRLTANCYWHTALIFAQVIFSVLLRENYADRQSLIPAERMQILKDFRLPYKQSDIDRPEVTESEYF